MTNPLRRDALLRLKVEADLARAVEATARQRGQTLSEFVRQGLRAQLARHGVQVSPDDGPRTLPAAALIEAANYTLPEGADPVPTGELPCRWEDRPDQPHASIASRVRLSNPGNGTGFIWGEIAAPLPDRIVHHPR